MPLNNIIDYFKSNSTTTKFLQTVEVTNFYWFVPRPTTCIIFYLPIPLTTLAISKKNCSFSIFLILKAIKKFIDLKSKTKYKVQKKLA